MKLKGLTLLTGLLPTLLLAQEKKPNIIFLLADDIGVREIPAYGSDTWYDYETNSLVQDESRRANTPILSSMARQGCWISTCWSCPVSMPSRAMLLSGRYAYKQKWWYNRDIGDYKDKSGNQVDYPIYESSPYTLASVARDAGYATFWAGKTQMPNVEESTLYGFDEGCYTGSRSPYTKFYLKKVKGGGVTDYINVDANVKVKSFPQANALWMPSVRLVNNPNASKKVEWWPNTEKSKQDYGVSTYGPDVEMHFSLDFIERKSKEGKPFFVYHASHLGHGAYNFLDPQNLCKLPATPRLKWDGKKYIRTKPNITGEKGVYDTHNTVTEPGLNSHLAYLDYKLWQYVEKLKELGEYENTIFIFSGDNGTGGYGKGSSVGQIGVQVPLIFYTPGKELSKQGVQDILTDYTDLLPTIAEIVGSKLPKGSTDGVSLVPYLFGKKMSHRDFIYSYKSGQQFIRGEKVMRDGLGTWYDVETIPSNLDQFKKITDWSKVSQAHRDEKKKLEALLPKYNLYHSEYNGPGGTAKPVSKARLKK